MAANRRPPDLSRSVTIILHRPAIPENIGSVARAMRNTGFSRLILSCPETGDWITANRLAVSASDILDRAPRCSSLQEAITHSRARFVVGTTARDRKYWEANGMEGIADLIMERALTGDAALVFGPESSGLSNEELTLCHATMTIPSEGELSSYNLAQAVLIVLFTIMTRKRPEEISAPAQAAPFEATEGMYSHIQDLLSEVGFLWEDNPDHMMRAVREFLNRAVPTETEVRMIRGICRRLLWHIRNKTPDTKTW